MSKAKRRNRRWLNVVFNLEDERDRRLYAAWSVMPQRSERLKAMLEASLESLAPGGAQAVERPRAPEPTRPRMSARALAPEATETAPAPLELSPEAQALASWID